MKKKMIILLSAMVICLIGIIVWYNVSLNLTDLVPDEVMKLLFLMAIAEKQHILLMNSRFSILYKI